MRFKGLRDSFSKEKTEKKESTRDQGGRGGRVKIFEEKILSRDFERARYVSLSQPSRTEPDQNFFFKTYRLDLDTPKGRVCAEPALTLCCFFDVIPCSLFFVDQFNADLFIVHRSFSAESSARRGASGARLLNIIALCNSLGLCGWIAGAACIRCGYVKLLGVSFFWRCFVPCA